MINAIEPTEFLSMIPTDLMKECKQFRITDQKIMELVSALNDMRAGIPLKVNVSLARLGSLDLRNNRFTNLETGRTFLIRFAKHNLHKTDNDWQVDIVKDYNYIIAKGDVITWSICKAPGKVFPLAYKEFLKCQFQGLNMPTINKLDLFYDRYIKSYNEIYQRELAKYEAQTCA